MYIPKVGDKIVVNLGPEHQGDSECSWQDATVLAVANSVDLDDDVYINIQYVGYTWRKTFWRSEFRVNVKYKTWVSVDLVRAVVEEPDKGVKELEKMVGL